MAITPPLSFDHPQLLEPLHALDDTTLDALDFGVIGFDGDTVVQRYSAYESKAAGLARDTVLGHPFFSDVAQCMNNYLVAQRFEDAAAAGSALDDTIDYVISLRMRPTPVKLRLLSAPGTALRYILVHRLPQ